MRSGDTLPYPVSNVRTEGNSLIWTPTAADTARAGYGKCELRWYVGDVLAKSELWMTLTADALGNTGKTPAPAEDYIAEMQRIGNQVQEAERHAPCIGENGNWWLWDAENEVFADSGLSARGPAGPQGPKGDPGEAVIDAALSQAGQAADAKNTGDELGKLKIGLGYERLTPTATADDYGLAESGLSVYNTSYRLLKYAVTEGEAVCLRSARPAAGKASYQFQSASNVSQSSNPYLIGSPVLAETDGYVTVPAGANCLILSVLKTDEKSGVYHYTTVDALSDSILEQKADFNKFLAGQDVVLDYSCAADGKSYGFRDFPGYYHKGCRVSITNNNAEDYNLTAYVKNGASVLQEIGVPRGETVSFSVHSDADMLRLYCNRYPIRGRLVIESIDKSQNDAIEQLSGLFGEGTDIVKMNADLPALIKSGKKLTAGNTVEPLCLLHFSDIHGDGANLARVVQLSSALGSEVDDVVFSGDAVDDKYADSIAFWGNVAGAENILTCIGNHDVAVPPTYNAYGDGVTPESAYDRYFAPYIANWGVVHSGSDTYYYKDYAGKHIRLIALDYLLTGDAAAAQNAWLQTALAGAKTNGYTVVIMEHAPVSNNRKIASSFTMLDKTVTENAFPELYQASVQAFIDNGGNFACFLTGHTHWDLLSYNSNFPDQLCVSVTCAALTGRDNDQLRSGANKTRDALNVVLIDTNSRTIKLIRAGADVDCYLRRRKALTISYAGHSIETEPWAALDGKITAPADPVSGQFLVYNGTAWIAQTLTAWQGGSY